MATPRDPNTPSDQKALARPVQDEWGFFDPDQAGLAAVIRRLIRESTIEPDAPTSIRPEPTV